MSQPVNPGRGCPVCFKSGAACRCGTTRTRPRLTPKVLRGLSTVEAHALADREVMANDEVTPNRRRTLAELDDGIAYIQALRAWFNNREKKP